MKRSPALWRTEIKQASAPSVPSPPSLTTPLTHPVLQLATIEPPNKPRVRSHVHRAFLTASAYPSLPLILTTTDVRTPKVTQLTANPVVEAVYWTSRTLEQFRVLGRAWVVPAMGYAGPCPAAGGVVYEALEEEGFDWEAKRVSTFNALSGHMRASWCRPVPGMPLTGGEEEATRWPEWLPKVGEARDEEEERNVERALAHFALLVIEPFEVDYVEFGVQPNRRRKFERDWEGRSVEFRETLVVP